MANEPHPYFDRSQPRVYEIRVRSHLDAGWADWFDGLSVTLVESGDTLLTGCVVDQAALHGVLKKVRDLGMSLISVNSLEPGSSTLSESVPRPHVTGAEDRLDREDPIQGDELFNGMHPDPSKGDER